MKNIVLLICLWFTFMESSAQEKSFNLIVGTYTKSCESDGIYVYDYNTSTAETSLTGSSKDIINPSYISVSPDKKSLYSVNENGKDSQVSAFSFDGKSGKLNFLNSQASEGADPCFIINDEKNVIAATYSGGTISVFAKEKNGKLSKAKQIVKHYGKSIDKRQESPHVHMVQFSPNKAFVLANDLGTDRIYLYEYHPDEVSEVLKFKDSIAIKTGSGPRHLTFSPDGKHVYLVQEFDGTITVFNYDQGKMRKIQESSLVDAKFPGETSAADIHISEDGKFLYATNRGEANTISLFAIDAKGKLTKKSTISTGGKGPRNFVIDPTGSFVLVAHQYSNDIVIFKRDKITGELTPTDKKIDVCSPVCLVFSDPN